MFLEYSDKHPSLQLHHLVDGGQDLLQLGVLVLDLQNTLLILTMKAILLFDFTPNIPSSVKIEGFY